MAKAAAWITSPTLSVLLTEGPPDLPVAADGDAVVVVELGVGEPEAPGVYVEIDVGGVYVDVDVGGVDELKEVSMECVDVVVT
jgi:hypothetical protein